MSTSEIIAELPKLDHKQRREIARRLFALESEAQVLSETDRRANENFLMLDALEDDDASDKSG
jgi:hypothetical protein